MTTPNIRAAMQKLLNEVHELRLEAGNSSLRSAIIEARDALAEPEPPADGEVAEGPSLKEQALELVNRIKKAESVWALSELTIISRALEALPND